MLRFGISELRQVLPQPDAHSSVSRPPKPRWVLVPGLPQRQPRTPGTEATKCPEFAKRLNQQLWRPAPVVSGRVRDESVAGKV